jgi:hypothetical protein
MSSTSSRGGLKPWCVQLDGRLAEEWAQTDYRSFLAKLGAAW